MEWKSYNTQLIVDISRDTNKKCYDERVECGQNCPACEQCDLLRNITLDCDKLVTKGATEGYTPSLDCYVSDKQDFMRSAQIIDRIDYYLYKKCTSRCESCSLFNKHICMAINDKTVQIYKVLKRINEKLTQYLDSYSAT